MREKQLTSLNERDALSDLLSTEKKLMSLYTDAIAEGSAREYREQLFKEMENVSVSAFELFDEMQTRGYYSVTEVKDEEISQKRKEMVKYMSEFVENMKINYTNEKK